MPGKKAPDYFPLNINMSGLGKGSYYGAASPVLSYHGKFDNGGLGMLVGSPMNTLTNNSPNNTSAFSTLSEYITLNGIPPVNSEDEEEDDDDIVSQSGSESVQGSDDLDVDIDDVDSLVLNIRDKLQMAPTTSSHWSGGLSGSNSTSECISPSRGSESDLLLHHHHHSRSSPLGFPNNGSINPVVNGSGGVTASTSRRSRNHPYSHVPRSMSFNHYHRKQISGSSSNTANTGGGTSTSGGSSGNSNGHNSYFRRFHPNPPGSIGKAKSNSHHHQKNWWTSSLSKSSSSISKQFSRSDDPYQLLQELLQSGSLIKEAVRRLNRKCLNSNGSNTNLGNAPPSNSITGSVICSSSGSSNSASNLTSNSCSTRFSFIVDEDSENSENSYPVMPISNQ